MSAPFSSTIAPNKSSAAPTPKAAALLTKAQVAQWNSYLATGRGSVALFASIDRDEDNSLTRQDISTFFDAIEESNGEQLPSNPKKVLDKRAADKPVTLQEFQEWLVQTTVEAGYHSTRRHSCSAVST
jgi:hypothetical protein